MKDLIKREDAIGAIEGTDWYHQNRNKDMVSGANSDEHQAWYKAEDVYKALKEVPSAEITHDDVMQYCNPRLLVLATVESIKHQYRIGFEDGKASADRPQGEVDAVEIYEKAESQLERNEITVGEFEKIIEPLRHLFYNRQGKWAVTKLYVQGEESKTAVRCPECKRIPIWLGSPILPTNSGNLDYCPHCGARMVSK